MDFAALTLKEAAELLPPPDESLKANLAFYRGDHWQDGRAWVGPILSSTHKLYTEIVAEIKREMVSRNVIAELVARHVAGVVGREPAWSLTLRRPLGPGEQPGAEEQRLIGEAEALLVSWWDGAQGVADGKLVGVHKVIQQAVATLLLGGRSPLRLFIPPGDLNERGQVPRGTPAASLQRLFVHQPDLAQATIYVDGTTLRPLGVYLYRAGPEQRAELCYTDTTETVIRLAVAGDEPPPFAPVRLPLSGQLTMYEMHRALLIGEQLRQLQKSLNLALTMRQRNIVTAGFLEATYFNTQLPGEEKPDPTTGQLRFIPDRVYLGPGARNFFSGLVTPMADGSQQLATPSVVYREPAPVEVFNATETAIYSAMLSEAQQLHAVLSGDAGLSGESRKQALADFKQSLLLTKPQVEAALRWLLETALALAAVFSGQPGRYAGLRVQANCHLEVGPLTADEQRLIGELVDKNLYSKETGRGLLGVEDTDAEAARVAGEQQAEAEQQQTTLASAVLTASRQVDSGAASAGLEQPHPAA